MPDRTPEEMVKVLVSKLTREEFCELFLMLDGDGPTGEFWELMGDQAQDFDPNRFGFVPADPLSKVKTPRPTAELRALIEWRDGFSPSTISGDERIRYVAIGLMDSSSPRVPEQHVGTIKLFHSMHEGARMALVRKVLLGS